MLALAVARLLCGEEYVSTKQEGGELPEALEAAYPGRISVEYVDLLLSPEERLSDAGRLLTSQQYPSPVVVIDGEPRFAGGIQIKRILTEVEKIIRHFRAPSRRPPSGH